MKILINKYIYVFISWKKNIIPVSLQKPPVFNKFSRIQKVKKTLIFIYNFKNIRKNTFFHLISNHYLDQKLFHILIVVTFKKGEYIKF